MLNLDNNSAQFQIRGYKSGVVQVNDELYTTSLIVSPTQLISDWPPQSLSDLKKEHLAIISTLKPAILLLGTGEKCVFPDIEIYGDLINQGISVEIMTTAAACRTYMALTSENRAVVAALLL